MGRRYTWSIASALGGTVLLSGPATVTNATLGELEIVLTTSDTVALTEPIYSYDVVETYLDQETTVVIGNIHTTARVTA